MKLKVLVLGLSALFASSAFADVAPTDAQQTQLDQLQAQINALKGQVNQVGTEQGNLGMLENEVSRNIFTDYQQPLGSLPNTGLSYALLQEQDQFNKSLVAFGGYLEGDIQGWNGNNIGNNTIPTGYHDGTALALTTAKLYTLANPNDWTQAFITVKGGLNGNSTTVSEAFLNFGNLSKIPLFMTVGKTYIPFGIFAGNGPWSNNLMTNAFRSNELSQMIFGYGKDGINTNIAVFNGANNFNDFAYTLQYTGTIQAWNISTGLGYLNDIRYAGNSIGNAYTAPGSATSTTDPFTGGRNPAFDANLSLTYNFLQNQSVGLAGEWLTTTAAALYNGVSTGKMSSWDVVGTYNTNLYNKASQFGLSYSSTTNMQNVPMGLSGSITTGTGVTAIGIKNQWLVYNSTEVLDNIFVGPEYSRQKLYNGASTWATTVDLSVYF